MFYKRTSRRSNNGLSIVEVIIAAGLSSLLMLLMLGVHRASYKVWNKSSDRSESLGRLQAAIQLLKRELRRAPYDGVALAGNGRAISFLTAENNNGDSFYDPTGALIWDHWIVYYRADNNLLRRDIAWGADASARIVPSPLAMNADILNGNGRVLVDNLKTFTIANPNDTKLFQIEIETTGTDKTTGVKVNSVVRPRN